VTPGPAARPADGLAQLLDRQRITEVLHRYCRAVDRLDRDLLLSAYHPDAVDDHGSFTGTAADFAARTIGRMAEAYEATQHRLANVSIDLHGDTAWVESYVVATHVLAGNAIEHAGARYVDRFERRDGEWRIATRVVVLDWYTTGSRGEPSDHLSAFRPGRRDREDPSYRRDPG
jgi:ketosteroid isomerase-like protein